MTLPVGLKYWIDEKYRTLPVPGHDFPQSRPQLIQGLLAPKQKKATNRFFLFGNSPPATKTDGKYLLRLSLPRDHIGPGAMRLHQS